jgi:L-fuconolactonase
MLRKDFNCGIDLLLEFGLAYDILIFERQLPQTIQFVDRHPLQVFVIDHIAKPRIRDHAVHPWRENLRSLADRPNVFCKLSGMVTEAKYTNWTDEDLAPYFDVVLDSFGPNRLMFGSDWPVCLVATTYRGWLDFIGRRIASLSNEERDAILGRTAVNAYRLLP